MKLLKYTLVFTITALLLITSGFASSVDADVNKVSKNINLTEKRQNLPPYVTPMHIEVGRTEDFTLVLTDSYGDGWDGAYMDVLVNGTLIYDDIAVASDEEIVTLAVNDGDLVETAYTSGSFEYEHSYAFYDQQGDFVAGDGPSPGEGISFTVSISYDVPGCMDDTACNYNADATVDDGSCCYDNCMTINFGGGSFISETSWELNDASGNILYQGAGSPVEGMEACLAYGTYTLYAHDSYGDGWNGNTWTLTDADGVTIATYTLDDGNEGEFTFDYLDAVYGCTDETAINYNPDATIDDGSCFYAGDVCEHPLDGGVVNGDPIYSATTEAYDADWYSFVVDADYDNVSVSLCGSDFDTKLEVWGACDDADYLGYNDDSADCNSRALQSQVNLTDLTAGTYYAKVYGYGSNFGNYILTITAFQNPTSPELTATGILNAVQLDWSDVPTRSQSATGITTINPVNKVESKPYEQNTADLTLNEFRTAYGLTVGGGSWDGEITWDITDLDANILYSGDAGAFDVDLADGTYIFNGYDSYGDGWNGATATLVDADGNLQFTTTGPESDVLTLEFTVPTTDVFGCTDPNALNYDPNATVDDGSCEYAAPANDECTSPELVTGPYPATVSGTNLGATIDCEGLLDWNAVWYEIDLPYAANNVTVTLCGDDAAISNAGIILMDDCGCDDYIAASYLWTDEGCIELTFAELSGLESVLYPANIEPQQNFTFTVAIEEVYLPSFNIYKDGVSFATDIYGNSFVDSDVLGETEYCYTVEQNLPDGTLSGMSNEACAMPATSGTGSSCEDALVAVEGQNDAEYMPLFYSYTAQSDCLLEVTSQNATGDAAWDTYLDIYGSCEVDGNGDLVDLLISNDDCCGYWGPSAVEYPVTAGQEVIIYWDDAWDSQPFTFFVSENPIIDCDDDEFEDDDTKDLAVNHGADGTFTYALCQLDNEGGIMQPSGVPAVDWSVVTLEPYHMLTVSTHGIGDPANDIDLFFEDYNGDGVCAWGGGDDIAGSGNMDAEEAAEYLNGTSEPMDIYIGVIYYAGEDPIPYELTITVVPVDCIDCPREVTATLSGDGSAVNVQWGPPYVDPTRNIRAPQISAEATEYQPEVFKLHSINQPSEKQVQPTSKGPKYTADLTLNEFRTVYGLTVGGGSFDSEITWDITDLDAIVFYSGIAGVFDIDLTDGTYIFNGYDSWGDGWNGATATLLDADGNVQFTGGLPSGDSFALEFTVPNAEVYGCTDPDASNYNPDATVDDGSCVYQGDSCDDPLAALAGENAGHGEGPQWFEYTATVDGLLTVTSQNDAGDAPWDTYLALLGSCDIDEDGYYVDVFGVNDDCCGYYGPSTVVAAVAVGQTVKIYWIGSYSPGPFTFWITEEELNCIDDEFEDNDSSPESAPITEGTYELQHCPTDPDWFEITVNNGQEFHLTVHDNDSTGLLDLGIWVFEIDDTYTQVYSPNEIHNEVVWINDSDHPMVANFAVGDFWDGVPESQYTMTIELVGFEQTTYTVYRSDNGVEEVAIASDILGLEYVDTTVESGSEYCYTATANVGEVEGGHSEPPACVSLVPPPDAPTNVQAVGAVYEEMASVVWSWDYEGYTEPANVSERIDIQDIINGNYIDRDVVGFQLVFEYAGTEYAFDTEYLDILIYGFATGDYVCGWVYAVDDGGQFSEASETACAEAGVLAGCEVLADNLEGWNLVSLPVGVEDASVMTLYPNSIEGTLFGYPYGDPLPALLNGDGYWLRFSAAGTNTLTGECTDDAVVSLTEGWNLIGSVSGSAGLADPNGVVIEGTLYDYPYGEPATSVEPGKGYWVRASAAGDVTVSTSALGGLARVSEPMANILTINGMKLYFGMDMNEKDALSFSMPPKPPTGAFDVRFAGDMRAIEESGMIQVQSANELSISWNVSKEAGDHMFWSLTTTSGEVVELRGTGNVELSGNINNITLEKTREVPEQFMLAQNFPNPFNPVTSIEYALPEEGFVKISVYNIMGQKVTELVNNVMPGGYHQVVWNGTNDLGESVSTGIYMYAIEAEGFTSVKKMILMK